MSNRGRSPDWREAQHRAETLRSKRLEPRATRPGHVAFLRQTRRRLQPPTSSFKGPVPGGTMAPAASPLFRRPSRPSVGFEADGAAAVDHVPTRATASRRRSAPSVNGNPFLADLARRGRYRRREVTVWGRPRETMKLWRPTTNGGQQGPPGSCFARRWHGGPIVGGSQSKKKKKNNTKNNE